MTKVELANLLHNKGYNCAQSVACVFYEELDLDEVTLFKACEGFGLGMGGATETCGAISGAIMVAGLYTSTGNLECPNSKSSTYGLCNQMVSEFKQQNTSTICHELKGLRTGSPLRSCNDCISDCICLVEKHVIHKI